MDFQIVEVRGKFEIQDAEGYAYGTYDKRGMAEQDAALWAEYYNS